MRARDIVGKRVKRVRQERTFDTGGRIVYDVQSIEFEDGTVLYLSVAELELYGDYAVEGGVVKGPPRRKRVAALEATKCRNCGEVPTVEKDHDDKEYPYVLRHPTPILCPATFHLESRQKTPNACIRDWNDFNSGKGKYKET